MEQEKNLYLLAQFDKGTQAVLSGIYDILKEQGFIGTQTKDIPYHFTLGSFDTDKEQELALLLDKVCQNTGPVEIYLDHIGLFGLKVLFVEPNMNVELLELERKFFPEIGRGCHPWAAHATILMDEPDVILKAIPFVNDNFKPFKAVIDTVGFYEFFPKRLIKEYALYGRKD